LKSLPDVSGNQAEKDQEYDLGEWKEGQDGIIPFGVWPKT
jgi:hypothetical protein